MNPSTVIELMDLGLLPNDPAEHIRGIQEKLRHRERMPELIIERHENGNLILIEGHCRATAYISLPWQRISLSSWVFGQPQDATWRKVATVFECECAAL
jgi:hypothetical protein